MAKSNLGMKGFILFHLELSSSSSLRKIKAGTQAGRKPEAETEVEAVEESFLTFLFSYSNQDHHCRCGTVHSEWALPHPLPIMKLCHRLAHRPIWRVHFLIWDSLFPHDSSLGRVKIKLNSTYLKSIIYIRIILNVLCRLIKLLCRVYPKHTDLHTLLKCQATVALYPEDLLYSFYLHSIP